MHSGTLVATLAVTLATPVPAASAAMTPSLADTVRLVVAQLGAETETQRVTPDADAALSPRPPADASTAKPRFPHPSE
jgi:hypothetical protein